MENTPKRLEADELVKQARNAELSRDFAKARELLGKAIDLRSRDADLHALKGWYTFNTSTIEWNERLRLTNYHINYALELNQNDPVVQLCWGKVQAAQGNKAGARAAVDNALRLKPDWKDAKALLDQINLAITPPPEVIVSWKLTKKSSLGRTIALAVVAALVAGGAAAYHLVSTDFFGRRALARDLGTRLKLIGAPQAGGALWLSVDKRDWEKLDEAGKLEELNRLAGKLEERGLKEIKIFSGGLPAALVQKGGKVCASPECLYGPGGPPRL